ncbi:hypothetical protein N781_02580 [Pontibacillus halophilus JSM 076056 = DSM 19796]|uniref:DUF72 domain-containing protein n=1 Tax=Pontibacillus halophilus JSM 076056 = DSM 19796 TaxID=1385510 RepID=A0A0A5GL53_9BACI|nr:hypothetical protein N781_02580 [Pontibacillus halophilus JSM 076056 = DSM 19796]
MWIGVTGWGDHDTLYEPGTPSQKKLTSYASHFPIVELDAAFYAIQPARNYEKWIKETPENFSFVVKAYNKMTGHHREKMTSEEVRELFTAYRESLQPLIEANKLYAVLFQFPPWFDVRKEHVQKIRWIRKRLHDLPLAIEFRNQSWFSEPYKEQTLSLLQEGNWIHSICDEPQAGEGSVPTVLEPTNKEKTIIRMHGRNAHGWNKNGREDWREVRFLYNYNEEELLQWQEWINGLLKRTESVAMLFNNNSGGHAADNAKQMMGLMGVSYSGLNPRQMDLFDTGES